MQVRMFYRGPFCRFWCIVLAFATAAGPSAAAKAQQNATESAQRPIEIPQNESADVVPQPARERTVSDTTLVAAPGAGKLDVRFLTPQAVAYAAARPHQFLTSPNTALFPVEVISAAGLEHLGIDPADVDEIVAFVEPPTVMGVSYGAIIKLAKPIDENDIPEKLRAHTQPAELAGKQYRQSTHPQLPSLYMFDPQTLLVMPDMTLRRVLTPGGALLESPMIKRLSEMPGGGDLYVAVDIASLRPLINPWLNVAVMQQREEFPEEAKPFLEIPNLVTAVDLSLNITHPGPTALVLHANDEASVDRLLELRELGLELQRREMSGEVAKLQQSEDPVERAFGKYMERMSNMTADLYRPERQGNSLVLLQAPQQGDPVQTQLVTVAVIGILVALLLPAIQAAREAARRNQSMSNMKHLLLAMHVYADSKRTFPPHASYSPDGKPLLSWRVHVLPYIEQQELYNQFHLDEPWDSEHNRALIVQMPEVYNNPNLNEPGKTNYLAVVGKECVLDGSANGLGMAQITDGTSKTIIFVEADADQAVEWTKPNDLEFNPNNPTVGFGKLRPGGCNFGWADGHVSFLPSDADPQLMKAFITRNGKEVVPSY